MSRTARAAFLLIGLLFCPADPAQALSGKVGSSPEMVHLYRTRWVMNIGECNANEPYQIYFYVPVSIEDQAPIQVDLVCPELIDYRFVRQDERNLLVAARLRPASDVVVKCKTWVYVAERNFDDMPSSAPFLDPPTMPDSLSQWLVPTDCVQIEDSLILHIADSLRQGAGDVIGLADRIGLFLRTVPRGFPHEPIAMDAVYTLKWGNTCAGLAHLGAALFRANGVPARGLLTLPSVSANLFQIHWIADFFVTGYGWVRMETEQGWYPRSSTENVIFARSLPEDEFPPFYPFGLDASVYASHPGVNGPEWNHNRSFYETMVSAPPDSILYARALTDSVFQHYVDYWGVCLPPAEEAWVDSGFACQESALVALQANDFQEYVRWMEEALAAYGAVDPGALQTVYEEDFEGGAAGWTHGGTNDEWELGSPLVGPANAHSGASCWGTDLDGTYENLADSWLLSPSIDLSRLGSAYLDFWVWNDVEDMYWEQFIDLFWVDISVDGASSHPVCDYMGGVNDDPEIPQEGGWHKVTLDLTPYCGSSVELRFRFQSDSTYVRTGVHVDDLRVHGRVSEATSVAGVGASPVAPRLEGNMPNPFNPATTIRFGIPKPGHVVLSVHDLAGRRVAVLADGEHKAGEFVLSWDGRDETGREVGSGIYFARLVSSDFTATRKMLLLR